ncbi:MAG TPA: SDR family oxidoreductase [Burkholderiaceae bacterium]|nr:SDR family oxidoreductase [Burkholderiaceae bacterium]
MATLPRIGDSLRGQRVLVTQSDDFMGPALCEAFAAHGAIVVADPRPLDAPDAVAQMVAAATEGGTKEVDVLVANLAVPAPSTPAHDVGDEEWRHVFAHLVDPLPRLARALLPGMIARRRGKIVVMGSATALRGLRRASTYSAARGAQLAWVRAVGTEVAPQGVQVNLIAQNFVDNPTYFPPEVQALEAFQNRLKREVPIGRLATPQEDALFAVFLASSEVSFFVGQGFAFSGGWVT